MPQKLLVIGGGIGGLSAIAGLRKLKSDAEICLVEPKDYCEIFWASYRSPFDENVAQASLLSLESYLEENNVRHVQTTVTKLDRKQAVLADGSVEDFDVCIIATGATSKWPAMGRGVSSITTRQERLQQLQQEGNKLLSAKSVLIVGGGLIGSELAGDVAGFSQKKADENYTPPKVTLIHSKDHLCPEFSPSAAKKIQTKLENLGVKVILNDHSQQVDGKMILRSTGQELEADQVVLTVGIQPGNIFVEIQGALDERGWIMTDEYCRVEGTDGKVFAFGDCCTHMPNSGNHLFANAEAIGNNLKVSLDDSGEKMKKIKPNPTYICCTVGPNDGVFYTPCFSTQYLVPGIKNSNMFLPYFREAIGYK